MVNFISSFTIESDGCSEGTIRGTTKIRKGTVMKAKIAYTADNAARFSSSAIAPHKAK